MDDGSMAWKGIINWLCGWIDGWMDEYIMGTMDGVHMKWYGMVWDGVGKVGGCMIMTMSARN
jgi:hypothetical protein